MTLSQSLGFLNTTVSACPLRDRFSIKRTSGPSSIPGVVHQRITTTQVLCQLNNGGQDEKSSSGLIMDRRDMLSSPRWVLRSHWRMPHWRDLFQPPDLEGKSSCHRASAELIPPDSDLLKCCPPYQGTRVKLTDYKFPKTPLRVRRPAHLAALDPESRRFTTRTATLAHYPPCIWWTKQVRGMMTGTEGVERDDELLSKENLEYLRKTFKEVEPLPELFMGDPGEEQGREASMTTSMGQLEAIHITPSSHFLGRPEGEEPHTDMGLRHRRPRLHVLQPGYANVDRLWELYRSRRGYRVEFPTIMDWLF
ncbi:hypothetical protein J5N97_001416 [Dioscorea zingiberensis]|uniref:Uncharacterized protein n=1 Tax=Dioscorea zingiberensis TaxID=325984 RepID=A0A9D5BTP0_9LILI|nr:hypothetical protein J5N97_001416 [Dioscorea zingiberensis]